MNDTQLELLDQVRQLLEGAEATSLQIESKGGVAIYFCESFLGIPAIAMNRIQLQPGL